jgi:hypothetical protein
VVASVSYTRCGCSEQRRERFLTGEELERLGSAIREAETKGIPWDADEAKPKAKHPKNRFTKIGPFAAAAIRLTAVFRLPAPGNPAPHMGAGTWSRGNGCPLSQFLTPFR